MVWLCLRPCILKGSFALLIRHKGDLVSPHILREQPFLRGLSGRHKLSHPLVVDSDTIQKHAVLQEFMTFVQPLTAQKSKHQPETSPCIRSAVRCVYLPVYTLVCEQGVIMHVYNEGFDYPIGARVFVCWVVLDRTTRIGITSLIEVMQICRHVSARGLTFPRRYLYHFNRTANPTEGNTMTAEETTRIVLAVMEAMQVEQHVSEIEAELPKPRTMQGPDGETLTEQADGSWMQAGLIPVAQVAPKPRTRKATAGRAPASPQTPATRKPRAKSDTWVVRDSEANRERTASPKLIASCLHYGMTPAAVVKLQTADAVTASTALGNYLVKKGLYKAVEVKSV